MLARDRGAPRDDSKQEPRPNYLAALLTFSKEHRCAVLTLLLLLICIIFQEVKGVQCPDGGLTSPCYTPLSEHLLMLPARLQTWASSASPVQRHACAPCGCAQWWGEEAVASFAPFCIADEELERLTGSVPPPDGAVAAAAAAAASQQLTSVEACYGLLAGLHATPHPTTPASGSVSHAVYHVYWKPDTGQFHIAHLAVLEAWLATQPESSVLVIWIPVPQAPPQRLLPLLRAFPTRLRIRALDVLWEAEGSPLAGHFVLRLHDRLSWIDGDVSRLVVLWRYGGFYFDFDTLLLRDATPLLGVEFATEFGCLPPRLPNGAVLHVFKRGPTITGLLRLASDTPPRLAMWTFGPWLLGRFAALPAGHKPSGAGALHFLPWCFYHGIWCGSLPREGLIGRAPWDRQQLEAVYGVHMHGAGNKGERIDIYSMLGTKMREHRATLEKRLKAQGKDSMHLDSLAAPPFRHWLWG